jgi:hypothetical protein
MATLKPVQFYAQILDDKYDKIFTYEAAVYF